MTTVKKLIIVKKKGMTMIRESTMVVGMNEKIRSYKMKNLKPGIVVIGVTLIISGVILFAYS